MATELQLAERREGTTADYGFVLGGSFYGVHQSMDGYPQGLGHSLAHEAAEISQSPGEWDRIAADMENKKWVDESDVKTVFGNNGSGRQLSVPAHPDGQHSDTPNNLLLLVPREEAGWVTNFIDQTGVADSIPHVHELYKARVFAKPSFSDLADMPTATKTNSPFGDNPSSWIVAADLDNKQFVIFDARYQKKGTAFSNPYATVDLDDINGLRDLSLRLGEAAYELEPPRLPGYFTKPPLCGPNIKDGMWQRPNGYPPLPGDPSAPMSGVTMQTHAEASVVSSSSRGTCGKPLDDGTLCGQKKPRKPGGKCAAGHIR